MGWRHRLNDGYFIYMMYLSLSVNGNGGNRLKTSITVHTTGHPFIPPQKKGVPSLIPSSPYTAAGILPSSPSFSDPPGPVLPRE